MCSSLGLDRLREALASIPRGMGREAVSSSGFQGWGRGVERRLLQTPASRHTACWEEGVGSVLKACFLYEATSLVRGRGDTGEEEEGEGVILEG